MSHFLFTLWKLTNLILLVRLDIEICNWGFEKVCDELREGQHNWFMVSMILYIDHKQVRKIQKVEFYLFFK